jgi:hypothetical protein
MPVRRALIAALAALGLVSLLVGVGMRTIWLPQNDVMATATLEEPGLVVTTAPGLLEARPGPVTVRAEGSGGAPVLLAVGRQGDVEAYVEGLPGASLTGFDATDQTRLTSKQVEGEPPAEGQPPLEDPARSDLWVQTETGTGSVSLTYEPPPGQWLLLAAGDGTSPAPSTLSITWPQEVRTPWSTPLVVLGVVLLLAAVALALLLRRWARETTVPPVSRSDRTETSAEETPAEEGLRP